MVSRYPKPGNKTVSNLTRVAGVGPDRRNKSKTKTVRGSTKHRSRSEELKPEPHMKQFWWPAVWQRTDGGALEAGGVASSMMTENLWQLGRKPMTVTETLRREAVDVNNSWTQAVWDPLSQVLVQAVWDPWTHVQAVQIQVQAACDPLAVVQAQVTGVLQARAAKDSQVQTAQLWKFSSVQFRQAPVQTGPIACRHSGSGGLAASSSNRAGTMKRKKCTLKKKLLSKLFIVTNVSTRVNFNCSVFFSIVSVLWQDQ